MPHTPADSKARESSLDELYKAINELEALITKEEDRERRMTTRHSARVEETKKRFSAFSDGAMRRAHSHSAPGAGDAR